MNRLIRPFLSGNFLLAMVGMWTLLGFADCDGSTTPLGWQSEASLPDWLGLGFQQTSWEIETFHGVLVFFWPCCIIHFFWG